ncbi:hypothetical protein PATSB16_36550 [Pandoraea thiooxydans]|nr:hypothetical protein PATSB16_36550 [Pandoraea thiooxydans]
MGGVDHERHADRAWLTKRHLTTVAPTLDRARAARPPTHRGLPQHQNPIHLKDRGAPLRLRSPHGVAFGAPPPPISH